MSSLDDVYPARWVGHCTCAGFNHIHELGCGWDIDDSETDDADELGQEAARWTAEVPVR